MALKKIFFKLFAEGAQNCKSENLKIEEQRFNSARIYHSSQLKRRFFHNFLKLHTNLHKKLSNSRFFYSKTLLKKNFQSWVESIPIFLDEKYEQEKQDDIKIFNFQRSFWVPKLFSAWVLSTAESKEQKLKDEFTQSMWEKAQLWLSEGPLQ